MFPVIQFLIAIFVAKACMDGTLVVWVKVGHPSWTPILTVVSVVAIWPIGAGADTTLLMFRHPAWLGPRPRR